jgi:hypothetical protein
VLAAGLDISTGVMTATYRKDPDDPKWANDAGVKLYRAFMEKNMPGADLADSNYFTGLHQGVILETLLKQCGNDLSRENILKQTRNIKGLALPMSLPGIVVNTKRHQQQDVYPAQPAALERQGLGSRRRIDRRRREVIKLT